MDGRMWGMKYCTGTWFNFSVAAGVAEVIKLRVGKAGELNGLDVSNAAFSFAFCSKEAVFDGEVEHGNEAGVLYLHLPEIDAGEYRYELGYTDTLGESGLLLHGTLTAISREVAERVVDEAEGAEQRVLNVSMGEQHGVLELRWAACSLAAKFAQEVREGLSQLEDVNAAVSEFRVYMAHWRDDLHSLLVMNPTTGTIWVNGYDTGERYRGEDGKAPRVNAYGFWEVFRDGVWVALPYQAAGRDGLDGASVRRVLLERQEDLPAEEVRGVIYYVRRQVWQEVGSAEDGREDEWEAFGVPAEVLPGVFSGLRVVAGNANDTPVWLMVRTEAGRVLAMSDGSCVWGDGDVVEWRFSEPVVVPAGEVVRFFLMSGPDAVEGGVPFYGVLMRSAAGDGEMSVRYQNGWYDGRCVRFEVLCQGSGCDLWAWLEPEGWVCFDHEPYGVATRSGLGLVMLGSDQVVEGGAPVGLDDARGLHVPLATTSVPGAARVSSDASDERGGRIHVSVSGSLFADVATAGAFGSVKVSLSGVLTAGGLVGLNAAGQLLVRLATPAQAGAVLPGSMYEQLVERPYIVAVGVDRQGRLANCLLKEGALQHLLPAQWLERREDGSMAWVVDDGFPVADAHYLGLVTTEQFGQSQAAGLELRAASEELLAGVYLASGPGDEREAAVFSAALARDVFALKDEVPTRQEAVLRSDPWLKGVVMTEAEYNALGDRVDPELNYVLI